MKVKKVFEDEEVEEVEEDEEEEDEEEQDGSSDDDLGLPKIDKKKLEEQKRKMMQQIHAESKPQQVSEGVKRHQGPASPEEQPQRLDAYSRILTPRDFERSCPSHSCLCAIS